MKNRCFSLVELLLVIGALVVLASLLQPSMKKMIGQAQQIQCAEQLKWMLYAFDQYCEDNLEYPFGDTNVHGWVHSRNSPVNIKNGSLWPYILNTEPFLCPSDETGHIRSYSVSHLVNNVRQSKPFGVGLFKNPNLSPSPRQTMMLLEEHDPRWFNMGTFWPGNWNVWVDNVAGWHDLGNNFAMMDGHIEYIEWVDDQTPNRFVERRNFRDHDDMIILLRYFTAGVVKP